MSARCSDSLDERAIRAVVTYIEEAWNRGDGISYAALFTNDCDNITLDGAHIKGRASNGKHHQMLFDSLLHGSRLRLDIASVRLITPDLALVHAGGSVSMPWQSADARRHRILQNYVVVRSEDGWRVAALQSVKVRPLSVSRSLILRLMLALYKLQTVLFGRSLEPVRHG